MHALDKRQIRGTKKNLYGPKLAGPTGAYRGRGCSPGLMGRLVEREAGRGALGLARDTAQARVRCGQRDDEGAVVAPSFYRGHRGSSR